MANRAAVLVVLILIVVLFQIYYEVSGISSSSYTSVFLQSWADDSRTTGIAAKKNSTIITTTTINGDFRTAADDDDDNNSVPSLISHQERSTVSKQEQQQNVNSNGRTTFAETEIVYNQNNNSLSQQNNWTTNNAVVEVKAKNMHNENNTITQPNNYNNNNNATGIDTLVDAGKTPTNSVIIGEEEVMAQNNETNDTNNVTTYYLDEADNRLDTSSSSAAAASGSLSNSVSLSVPLFYSVARYDRSGSVIQDMLHAHAYAYANNLTYAGACICCRKKARAKERRPYVESLLAELGLDGILKYACPDGDDISSVSMAHRSNENKAKIADFYNPKWKEFFLSQWEQQRRPRITTPNNKNNASAKIETTDAITVAVHIRRGDVNPCRYPDRYKPNGHYLRLIDEYTRDLATPSLLSAQNVYIYSESDSFEPFDEFIRRNYTMMLDTDIPGVWTALMTADLVITSVSSFSYVPAVLNYKKGSRIVQTPGGFSPLPHWIVVNSTFMSQTGQEQGELRKAYCWGNNNGSTNGTRTR